MTPSPLKYINDNIHRLYPENRIIGSYLYDLHDEMVGRIQGLMVDPETYSPRYLVLTVGGFLFTEGKIILFPRNHYETLDMGKVKTSWRRDSIQQSPSINSVESLTLEKEQKILSYFDLEPYWDTTETNSNP
ncbi:MAG: PRC-barrel domain-containing protein [Nitrospinota bacterium]|nr:PRC-barrel domain-containing protein [Nitrospinota bacterium]